MRTPRWVTRSVARAKPVVPEAAWPALLSLRSWAGSGPLVGLPSFRRVLVLAPHPDDESIGAGGTVRLLVDHGATVAVAFATFGESTRGSADTAAEVSERRRSEAEAACRLLGAEPIFLGQPDGALCEHVAELALELTRLVEERRPEVLFLPWFADGHPDHEACTAAVAAARLGTDVEVWGYETWTPLPANRIVDITDAYGTKKAAVAAHATAHLAFDVGATLGLSRYRSVHGLMGRGYAEGFLAAPAGRYLEMAERLTAATGG